VEWTFFWLHKLPADQVSTAADETLDILGHGLYGGKGQYTPATRVASDDDISNLQGFNREEQNRLKQEAFYKTGTLYFNRQGFNGTSLDDIAEHLDVSKGAFYYHIRNKEDLLFNCYQRSLDISEKIHQQAAAVPGNGLQKVEQSCRRIFHAQNSDLGPLIRYNTITALPDPRRRQVLQRTDEVNQFFVDFIRAGIDDGSVRPINLFIAENLITGALNAAMNISVWRRVDDLDDAATDYFDVFFNGLLARD